MTGLDKDIEGLYRRLGEVTIKQLRLASEAKNLIERIQLTEARKWTLKNRVKERKHE